MIRSRFFCLVLLLFSQSILMAQDIELGPGFRQDKKGSLAFYIAEEHYDNGAYLRALPLYRSLEPLYGNNDYLIFKIGICLLHKTDEAPLALDYLLRVKEKNPKAADIDLLIARAYHLNERYDEGIASVETYLGKKNIKPENRAEAEKVKKYCLNAKELKAHPVAVNISNIGEPVNTGNSEYVPVVTADDSLMIFTYRGSRSIGGLQLYPGTPDTLGEYYEDIFVSRKSKSSWTAPASLDTMINTYGHDACIGISNDGLTLLIFKGEEGNGDIYLSALDGLNWSWPQPVRGDVNSSSWEGSATLSNDLQTMYFASERPGGFGGRDIYVASQLEDGTWGKVKNLGPKINTADNEDAPFLHPNGITLIFSSEGHNSMGGYDIFHTDLEQVDSAWAEPSPAKNMGYPINTPGDDKYFVLGADGRHGYYSSGKPGGLGEQDIYLVSGDFGLKDVNVLMVYGVVTKDEQPARATVNVRDEEGKLRKFSVHTNPATGKYLMILPQGKKYKITYELEGGVENAIKTADGTQTGPMKRIEINVPFYSPGYKVKRALRVDSALFKTIPLDSLSMRLLNPYDYDMIVKYYGEAKSQGLYFRVQVAAYNFPAHYASNHLDTLGPIDRIVLDDGITRFTMGKFETLGEAEAYRQKIIKAGQTDAFVTAEKEGKRYLMKDLVTQYFFQGPEFFDQRMNK
ncbi:MAG TPA: hypothetical protein VI731_01960 [Bacteroidia bacterium]|nr:hypothetical protein [Bacteroidia bacterium]